MKRDRHSVWAAATIVVLVGSAAAIALAIPQPDDGQTSPDDSRTSQAQVLSDQSGRDIPVEAPATLPEVVAGNNSFGFNLLRQLSTDSTGNVFFSPYSVTMALAMTYAGARGETESEMASTLQFSLPQTDLHRALNYIDWTMTHRGYADAETGLIHPGPESEGVFTLTSVNDLWLQNGLQLVPDYVTTLDSQYGAIARLMDFGGNPEGSRLEINQYVSDHTENKINDLIPEGAISPATNLVLTNAVYFNASWARQFNVANTTDGAFTALDGTALTVPMMHQTHGIDYVAGAHASEDGNSFGYQAVQLPYVGGQLAMLLIVPDAGTLPALESQLDTELVDGIVSGLSNTWVSLAMPRFRSEWGDDLGTALRSLGMVHAFTDADFSGIDGTRQLVISAVIHKAFVDIDEEGTEAAAATAVIIGRSAVQHPEPVVVDINRPFIVAIRDIDTGTILFLGRVANPQG